MVMMLSRSEQSKTSAWNQAGNFGGGVLGAAVVLWLIDRLFLPLVGLAAAALVALPSYVAFLPRLGVGRINPCILPRGPIKQDFLITIDGDGMSARGNACPVSIT
jgi:hypothetical protein